MGNQLSQLWPPKPRLTEQNLSDQSGKVVIITGGSSGVGEQLAYILYKHNAKVYIAARSEEKSQKAIERIRARVPQSNGQLIYLHLDLDDLITIKHSADEFLSQNERLDVLVRPSRPLFLFGVVTEFNNVNASPIGTVLGEL